MQQETEHFGGGGSMAPFSTRRGRIDGDDDDDDDDGDGDGDGDGDDDGDDDDNYFKQPQLKQLPSNGV